MGEKQALRPYQEAARKSIHTEWENGRLRTLLVLPTGTGKTIVFASVAADQVRAGDRVLILAHRGELLEQAADKLQRSTGLVSAVEKAESTCLDSWYRVVVGSVQTLQRPARLERFPRDYFGTIIIDEAQFLTKEEVYYLVHLVDDCNIPVICYGLRADFKGDLFPGSYHLLVLADKLEEVKTICWCGKKAAFNARFDDQGHVLKEGEQVVLGANDQYIGLCRRHWMAGDLGPDFHRLRK